MAKTSFLWRLLFPAVVCAGVLLPGANVIPAPQVALVDTLYPALEARRRALQKVYRAELGVKEATGNNDGGRVEAYLAYTGLPKGNEWCAAFVSWCHAQIGCTPPRNAWSPALFPKRRTVWRQGRENHRHPQPADVFGLWDSDKQRIAHVGFIDQWTGTFALTVEGNSNNRVERRRRPCRTIYRVACWLDY